MIFCPKPSLKAGLGYFPIVSTKTLALMQFGLNCSRFKSVPGTPQSFCWPLKASQRFFHSLVAFFALAWLVIVLLQAFQAMKLSGTISSHQRCLILVGMYIEKGNFRTKLSRNLPLFSAHVFYILQRFSSHWLNNSRNKHLVKASNITSRSEWV